MVWHMSTTELLSSPQVAAILGKSARTIHRLVESGDLVPAFKAPGGPNGAYLFAPDAVEAYRVAQVAERSCVAAKTG